MPLHPSRILCVGKICLDEINVCEFFPIEDTDCRIVDRYNSRGGNASNTCTVLAEVGAKCECFGTLAEATHGTRIIEDDFVAHNIKHDNCPKIANSSTPTACVIINTERATRTIMAPNSKNCPELSFEAFADLMEGNSYGWIYFEGRNSVNVAKMMHLMQNKGIPLSVEIEKVGRGAEALIPLGDVVTVGKDVAQHHGARDMISALELFKGNLKDRAKLIITWGDSGACGYDSATNCVVVCPSFSPDGGVVDSLGAGDTFNATLIHCMVRGASMEKALYVACKVAGAKVGQKGFEGLKRPFVKAFESC